jgi:hypothetical protein
MRILAAKPFGCGTAVTALLCIKGKRNGAPFERRRWFSDTYVRTPSGWKYASAEVSLPLPSN